MVGKDITIIGSEFFASLLFIWIFCSCIFLSLPVLSSPKGIVLFCFQIGCLSEFVMFGLGIKLVFARGRLDGMGWRPDEKVSEGLHVGDMACGPVC